LQMTTAFELSRKRQARASEVSDGGHDTPMNEGVRWNDTTTQSHAGRTSAAQSV
jgi:hypothetical protein